MYNTIGMPEFYQEAKRKKLPIIDDKNQPYYLICQMGSRSAQACAFLSQQGYQVTNVLGGTSGWLGQLEQ